MATITTQTEQTGWERLKDSSWVTLVWEWVKMLLARVVDPALWITMIFSASQLIPGAPKAPGISTAMFILQFTALDIGGLGMLQLANQYHLDKHSLAKRVAYALIATTLITMIYAGIEHAMLTLQNPIPDGTNSTIEVILVIIRGGLTVLYGPAINSLKALEKQADQHLQDLERDVNDLRRDLKAKELEVKQTQGQLASMQKSASNLQVELSNSQEAARVAIEQLQGKLGVREQELEMMGADQAGIIAIKRELNAAKLQTEDLRIQLENEHAKALSQSDKLQSANLQIAALQSDLQTCKLQSANLQADLQKAQEMQAQRSANYPAISPKMQSREPAKTSAVKPANAGTETAKANRIADAEIIAFMAANPTLKRSEVAERLGISERKVYNAVAWQKEQESL